MNIEVNVKQKFSKKRKETFNLVVNKKTYINLSLFESLFMIINKLI